MQDMDGIIPAVLEGGPCSVGVESTVLSLAGGIPRLLRPGGITPHQIEEVIGAIEIDPSILEDVHLDRVSSPGMKYKHYAPKAKVILLRGSSSEFSDYVNRNAAEGVAALCFSQESAHLSVPCLVLGGEEKPDQWMFRLFSCLREADDKGFTTVYAHCPPKEGAGLAVYNRLIRAAAFDEREL
ncbi:MAG: translation factor SUA5, partial [Clostridia bacterium]|nr:translation factor SUA5 [Clostridia bacterium]